MTDISCMGYMFQDTVYRLNQEAFCQLYFVFCLTNVKLLPPALYKTVLHVFMLYAVVSDCGFKFLSCNKVQLF